MYLGQVDIMLPDRQIKLTMLNKDRQKFIREPNIPSQCYQYLRPCKLVGSRNELIKSFCFALHKLVNIFVCYCYIVD